jgi:adenosylmethionine-8-amino-7-oxononanoate aminotransferase
MLESLLAQNVLVRPLGNTIYLMPPYCISDDDLARVFAAIRHTLESVANV